MKATEITAASLKDKTVTELKDLEKTLRTGLWKDRFSNFTNQLNDTSILGKTRKAIARVKTEINARAK